MSAMYKMNRNQNWKRNRNECVDNRSSAKLVDPPAHNVKVYTCTVGRSPSAQCESKCGLEIDPPAYIDSDYIKQFSLRCPPKFSNHIYWHWSHTEFMKRTCWCLAGDWLKRNDMNYLFRLKASWLTPTLWRQWRRKPCEYIIWSDLLAFVFLWLSDVC